MGRRKELQRFNDPTSALLWSSFNMVAIVKSGYPPIDSYLASNNNTGGGLIYIYISIGSIQSMRQIEIACCFKCTGFIT